MISYINDREDFRELFRNTKAANGLNAIYSALLHDLVLVLSRIYDPPKGRDRASLPHLMVLLKDVSFRKSIIEHARTSWHPRANAEHNAALCSRWLTTAINQFALFEQGPLSKNGLAGLRWFRNNYLAHSLFRQSKRDVLLYGQLGELFATVTPIVRNLERAIKGNGLEDRWPIVGHDYAWTFWPVVERGMKAARRK